MTASPAVAIVTDSTASLPSGRDDVAVVPLRVHLGPRSAQDGVEVDVAAVVAALRDRQPVSTSRPNPSEFAAAYRAAFDAGASHVVSIHLAAALSGTWESAVLASQDFEYGRVRVIDSRSAGMGLGYAVAAAADVAAGGGSPAEVQEAAVRVVDHSSARFYVDSIDHLRRGGRLRTASALLATSLAVKPLLKMVDGQIVPEEKVRTSSKALARLAALTAGDCAGGRVDVAVQHLAAAERAETVAELIRGQVRHLGELTVSELGPVLGVHLGPGAIGTVVVRRD